MPRSKNQRIRDRYLAIDRDEFTSKEIADLLGTSTATISRIHRELGIKKKAPYIGFPSILDEQPAKKKWFIENHLNYTVKEMAKLFGVVPSCIMRWRKKLGLPTAHTGKWSRSENQHPKGYAGYVHSEDARAKMSAKSKRAWADPNSRQNSEEMAQWRSDEMMKRQAMNKVPPGHSRGSAGYRKDLGDIYFRSSWEANYARYLNLLKQRGEIHDWKFEARTFWFEAIRRGIRSYKPDFEIYEKPDSKPYYVEVKGWMDPKSVTKLKRMKKYYPEIDLRVVDSKAYGAMKNIAYVIPNWEFDSRIKAPAA